jgi:hypothetical protein
VVVRDEYPNSSVCGLPFLLSGGVEDWHDLAHRAAEELADQGIALLLDHTERLVDGAGQRVEVIDDEGEGQLLSEDRFIVATEAEPAKANIAGLDRKRV